MNFQPALSLTAGDTWTWTVSPADYPASQGWSVLYVFTNADQRFQIASAASVDDHVLSYSAANSSAVIPGIYGWTAFAKKGAERYTLGVGQIEITPNVEATRPYDTRSKAKIIYDQLVDLWVSHSSGQALASSYMIEGRSMTFKTSDDLLSELSYWEARVNAEIVQAKREAGEGTGQRLYFSLTKP